MRVRIESLEGGDHIVVPMVMLREGAHHGLGVPLFYPAEEIRKTVLLWNGRPVVVYHPDMSTNGCANHPKVFNRQKIGTIFNATCQGVELKAEAWIDLQRVARIDPRVIEAIRNSKPMEVSTGLYTYYEPAEGTFNGKSFGGIARGLLPDHLAVLPDQVGACSLKDGCGLMRNSLYAHA